MRGNILLIAVVVVIMAAVFFVGPLLQHNTLQQLPNAPSTVGSQNYPYHNSTTAVQQQNVANQNSTYLTNTTSAVEALHMPADLPSCGSSNAFFSVGPAFVEDPNLALVYDEINTSIGIFSVGTSMYSLGLPSAAYYFVPSSSGTVNRNFNSITPGEDIYCYQTTQQTFSSYEIPSRPAILIQLVNSTHLRWEFLALEDAEADPGR